MIRKEDKEIVSEIKKFITDNLPDGITINYQKYEWCDTLDRMVRNLEKAPLSYEYPDPKTNFYACECEECGWWGSSELCDGGTQIADTGDYDDIFCPVCGSRELLDVDTPDPKLLNKILYKSNLDHCQSADDMQNALEEINDLIKENHPNLKEDE